MFRSMTFKVSTFSGFVTKGHQTMQYVSSSPSKIPYVGFSPVRLQTGIQLEPSSDHPSLSTGPAYPQNTLTYIQSQPNFFSSIALQGKFVEDQTLNNPVQRPLAPRPVMLSGQISAYYGLIRNSRSIPSTYGLYDGDFALRPGMGWYREAPQFTLYILSHRAASCTPVDREGAFDCSFPSRSSLRHLCTGSASTTPCPPVLAWEA